MLNITISLLLLCFPLVTLAETSTCYGTTANGRLENAVQLPSEGGNFVSYSSLAKLMGRTYVHSEVEKIIVSSYKTLKDEQPTKVYKYAETGLKNGGHFKPHKTHQNGLSVDFMTPMIDKNGKSVHLPTNAFNKLGYAIELDKNGNYKDIRIDYDALAAHIVALDKQAKKQGHDLWRVIFDPDLQPKLFETQYADYLKANIQFSKKRSWVRHDEHYHVDFSIKCKLL